jgi:hypothetical protein
MHQAGRDNLDQSEPRISGRALITAAVLLVLVMVAGLYIELIYYLSYRFAGGVPPIAPLAIALLLAILNPALPKLGLRAFSRRELLVIYAILSVGAPLMSHGLLWWLLSCSVGQRYLAAANPGWDQVFIQRIPLWFSPTNWSAVEGYFQGGVATPWADWGTPLLAWGSFYLALFVAGLCLMLLFERQWISHERLTFPLAMVPLEMVREDAADPRRIGRVAVTWAFWVGFAVSALFSLQDLLPTVFPALPSIPTLAVVVPWQKVGPLAGLGDIWLVLWPWAVALAYLLPKELSFSVWFFWIVRVALTVMAIAAGATPQKPEEWPGAAFPAPALQGGGAILGIFGLSLWAARKHLARAFRSVLTVRPATKEDASLRWAVWGLLSSCSYLMLFGWWSGARLGVSALLIGLILVYYLVWARLRAENGMSCIAFPYFVDEMLLRTLGSSVYYPAEIILVNATRWAYFCGWGDTSEVLAGASMDAFKIADSARIPRRRLTLALIGGFCLALVVGLPLLLSACYRHGSLHMHAPVEGWVEMAVRAGGAANFDLLTNPSKLDPAALVALACGAGVAVFLGLMRLNFWWWPFHPIGYLAANVWGSQWWYMPFLIGWLAKTLIIRYGGLRLYQRTVPAAIGVIVGDRTANFLWPAIMWAARSFR